MQNWWIFDKNWILCINMSRVKNRICLWMQNFAFWKTWHQSKHFWETGHVLRNAKFCIQKEIWFFTWQHLMFSVQFFLKNSLFTLSMPGLNRCEINTIDQLNCFYLMWGLWCMHKTLVLVIFPWHSSAFHHRTWGFVKFDGVLHHDLTWCK